MSMKPKMVINDQNQFSGTSGRFGGVPYGLGLGGLTDRAVGHRIDRGLLTTTIELNHLSVILYAVPVARIATLVPAGLFPETTIVNGEEMAWISVLSWQDRRAGGIEHTSYRLHVFNEGKASFLILGLSLGSLAAVGPNNLWQMPWHLGAMELQAAYDHQVGRYRDYRLQTQSQWDNACWDLKDLGEAIEVDDDLNPAPHSITSTVLGHQVQLLYRRADQTLGRTEIAYGDWMLTRGVIRSARSEYLERSGILSREELSHPVLVGLQPRSTATLSSWTVEKGAKSLVPLQHSATV